MVNERGNIHHVIPAECHNVIPAEYHNVIPAEYHNVIPAQAGIYGSKGLDPRLRGDDGMRGGDDE